MAARTWETTRPPNEVLIEIEHGDDTIIGMAVHGGDGVEPHWTNMDRSEKYPPEYKRWRHLKVKKQ